MPGFDGTGPLGYGPVTGRGRGTCGRGLRCGSYGFRPRRGFGRGFGFGPMIGGVNLRDYKRYLEDELKAVKEELAREENE